MKNIKIQLIVGILFLNIVIGNAQGFYIAPAIGYGFALRQDNIGYTSSATNMNFEAVDQKTITYNRVQLLNKDERTKSGVPMGQGKTLALNLGYETSKLLCFGLNLHYWISDKAVVPYYSFTLVVDEPNRYRREGLLAGSTILTMHTIGVQPWVGVYKNIGRYKVTGQFSGYIGICRMQWLREWEQYQRIESGDKVPTESKYANGPEVIGLKGSVMYGGGVQLQLERNLGKNSSLYFYLDYSARFYKPSKAGFVPISRKAEFLGSLFTITGANDVRRFEPEAVNSKTYRFEAVSFGIGWKRYLHRKRDNKEIQ